MEIKVYIDHFPEIPSPVFYARTAQIWYSWVIRNLRRGRDFYGRPFEPLSPLTMASRRGRKGVPLNDTGRLGQSIQVYPIPSGIVMRSNVIYAKTHQFGAVITPKRAKFLLVPKNPAGRYWGKVKGARFVRLKEVKIPSRPFFPLPNHDLPPELIQIWLKAV